jgi:hypothetical protein
MCALLFVVGVRVVAEAVLVAALKAKRQVRFSSYLPLFVILERFFRTLGITIW